MGIGVQRSLEVAAGWAWRIEKTPVPGQLRHIDWITRWVVPLWQAMLGLIL
jgi:hypothetical protein